MSDEFLMPEDATVEIVIKGKKFKIRPLNFEEFRKVLQFGVSLGLVSGPFPIDEKTIERLKLPVLSKLNNEILSLTSKTFTMHSYAKENPLAA